MSGHRGGSRFSVFLGGGGGGWLVVICCRSFFRSTNKIF